MRCACTAELEPDSAFCGVCGLPTRPRRPSLVGVVLEGRFQIVAKLAAGGFAVIYRAIHLESGSEVALKVLHPEMSAVPELAARFRREGAALARLRDPHTVLTYELGETLDGTMFIAMELLGGVSLLDRFRATGPLPWRRVLAIARAVCGSLGEAHELGIVHRDVKPANIHLERRDGDPEFVKVLDFGVAKLSRGNLIENGNEELTQVGEAIGTIDYMAPEQLVGSGADPRTDIYGLGVVMFEMLTGHRPFADATGATGLITALLTRTAAPPSTVVAGLAGEPFPLELDRVVLRCLQRDPRHRFQDVRELAAAIDRVLSDPGVALPTQLLWTRPPAIAAANDATWIDAPTTQYAEPYGHPHGDGNEHNGHGELARLPTEPAVHPAMLAYQPPSRPLRPSQMPMFEVPVAGTDVRFAPDDPADYPGPLGALRVAFWSVVLLAAGLAIGATVASAL